MDGYGGGGSIQDPSKLQDLSPFAANPTGNNLFDASQYEFFGGDAVEEVELGGLEDEEDGITPVGFEEEEFQLDMDKEEGDVLGTLSEIDDLSSTFSKLNKVTSGPTSAGFSRDWGSRESLTASGLGENPAFNNWLDPRSYDAETIQESQNWPSHTHPSPSARFMDPNPLHRTSSYPEHHPQQPQNHHHQYSSEPIPNSPFTSYPLPGGRSQQGSPNGLSNILYRPQIPGPNLSSFPNPNSQLSQFGGNLPQYNSQTRVNQNILYPRNHSDVPNNYSSQQNGLALLPPQRMIPPQQTRMPHPFQPSIAHLQSQSLNPQLSLSPPNFDMSNRHHPMMRYHPQGASGWPRFRSKYMTANEIDNIHRAQLAATHSNDPYVEDYYHQAILARKSTGAKLRHHFCPTNLKDGSSRTRESNEPHPFLKVDALGRICFSSIRTPRPLLEVDSPKSPKNGGTEAELKPLNKPLEQEPMLAARVAIEDGICLLLEVDDIDRFLQFNQIPDGGAHLRHRRQVLLEGLASSLQLIDPLRKNGNPMSLSPRDDFVFLRLVSLPKGKKLVLRYLEVLSPGELSRVVCMAICRNLRFLFGNITSDSELSTITRNLSKNVSSCANLMDLESLSACLVSVVCGPEQPPLRPIGHISGDGASVILKCVLERATEVMKDSRAVDNCSVPNRAFWQASFDAFFEMLMKYCFNRYDSALQSLLSQSSPDASTIAADVAKAISKEMPVELLRASIPHTSDQQRKLILEFAQRSMPVGFGGSG